MNYRKELTDYLATYRTKVIPCSNGKLFIKYGLTDRTVCIVEVISTNKITVTKCGKLHPAEERYVNKIRSMVKKFKDGDRVSVDY